MTTITINNPEISKKYTDYEISLKLLNFLEIELKESSIELFEISINDLSEKSKKRLKNIENLNFVNY